MPTSSWILHKNFLKWNLLHVHLRKILHTTKAVLLQKVVFRVLLFQISEMFQNTTPTTLTGHNYTSVKTRKYPLLQKLATPVVTEANSTSLIFLKVYLFFLYPQVLLLGKQTERRENIYSLPFLKLNFQLHNSKNPILLKTNFIFVNLLIC